MRISNRKKQTIVIFDSVSDDSKNLDREQQTGFISKFLSPQVIFPFPKVTNHEEINKFKNKVVTYASQHGQKNQKTTAIFLSFLQYVRQIASSILKNRDYYKAATYYTLCLSFVQPDDDIFLQKFITIKIDIVNKLMFCIFQLEKNERMDSKNDLKIMESAYNFIQNFLQSIQQYSFYRNLLKSQHCLLELNYFFSAKLQKRRRNLLKAISHYHKVLDIIRDKLISLELNSKIQKTTQLLSFLQNLQIKTNYKISKCYREEGEQQQQQLYQNMALKKAKDKNRALYLYIEKKIRFYQKKKNFQILLRKLEGKKKIQEEVNKAIEETKQIQIESLYDVYRDQ